MKAPQAMYPVRTTCRVLEVSASGYYAWLRRPPCARKRRDEELKPLVSASHARSNGTYGRPRIHEDLKEAGVRVAAKRIRRLMKELDLEGVSRRRRTRTTQRDEAARPAPDLVDRQFVAEGPDRLWVADITYIPRVPRSKNASRCIALASRSGRPPRTRVIERARAS